MKIIVTGGTGFLGRHLVWRLAAEGNDVIFTGRKLESAQKVIQYSAAPITWLPFHHGSAGSVKLLSDILEGADAVVHCAALSSPWGKPENFQHANIESAKEITEACKISNVKRFVHISTPSIYFEFSDKLNIKETAHLPTPVNEYAHTKAIAEQIVTAAQIPETVILRPRGIFGPWDNTLMPRLIRVIKRGPIPLMRGGKALLDLTYVDNVVEAICLALTKPLVQPISIYNVTNGEPLPLDELLIQVANLFKLKLRMRHISWRLVDTFARILETHARLTSGDEPLLTRYGAGVLAFSQTLDISAICNELEYKPLVSIKEGIARHAEWHSTVNTEQQ